MKRFFSTLATVLAVITANAQFTTAGKIEYERKVNVYAQMEEASDDDNGWFARVKSQIPKFQSLFFDLTFDTARSLYKPGKEVENTFKGWGSGPATENVVYTNYNTKRVTANKIIYEQKFLVQDSMRKIDWRLKDEIRTINNFKCRKAVGKICDSVYVVAFYTEDIIVSGGPEMFGGLPGMILELAIPRLHCTWVADKIEVIPPKEADFVIPEKGKKVTEKELFETVKSSFKDWGKWADRNIWWTVL